MTAMPFKLNKVTPGFVAKGMAALPLVIGTCVSMAAHPQYMQAGAMPGMAGHFVVGVATMLGAALEGGIASVICSALGDGMARGFVTSRGRTEAQIFDRKLELGKTGAAIGAGIGILFAIPGGIHGYHWASDHIQAPQHHTASISSASKTSSLPQPVRVTRPNGKTATFAPNL